MLLIVVLVLGVVMVFLKAKVDKPDHEEHSEVAQQEEQAQMPPKEIHADPQTVKLPGKEVVTKSGLRYADIKVGSGRTPVKGDNVSVGYTGWLVNGEEFDSSAKHGEPLKYIVGEMSLIPGWEEGLASMKVGGKRKLIIPPKLGYGSHGSPPSIPPDATLVFVLELVDAKPGKK